MISVNLSRCRTNWLLNEIMTWRGRDWGNREGIWAFRIWWRIPSGIGAGWLGIPDCLTAHDRALSLQSVSWLVYDKWLETKCQEYMGRGLGMAGVMFILLSGVLLSLMSLIWCVSCLWASIVFPSALSRKYMALYCLLLLCSFSQLVSTQPS